jgi:HrpA-like RNA helicase
MLKIFTNIWRFNDFWKYTNILWYFQNLLFTIIVLISIIIKPFYKLFVFLRELHFYHYGLRKKDIKFHRVLTQNYEAWIGRSKDKQKFKKKHWLEEKCYQYSKTQLNNENK